MQELEGVLDSGGNDVTSEYLGSEAVETYHLYDVHYDDDQPPLYLTNHPDGADFVLKSYDEDEPDEERRYIAAAIGHGTISVSSAGELSSTDLTVYDEHGIVESLFRRQSMNSCAVVIRKVFADQSEIWPHHGLLWRYRVSGYTLQGPIATLTLGYGLNLLGAKIGRVAYRTCPWTFGGQICKYAKSDGEICGKTYDSCRRKNNLKRFGGFPGLRHGEMRMI
ncbi:MAG: hypothetical protein AB7E51_02330 [Pseudodesulfovibrio sp.]|uniref:hypothetical protein n=1 Tax=Pseudodesulfovibrio sp. TaxID=2035812 RepID=UPI003D0E46A0